MQNWLGTVGLAALALNSAENAYLSCGLANFCSTKVEMRPALLAATLTEVAASTLYWKIPLKERVPLKSYEKRPASRMTRLTD